MVSPAFIVAYPNPNGYHNLRDKVPKLSYPEGKHILNHSKAIYKREEEREKKARVSLMKIDFCIIRFSHGLHNRYL